MHKITLATALTAAALLFAACDSTPTTPPTPPVTGSGAKVETVESLTTKAAAGDLNAQFELGTVYHDGSGAVKDLSKAREWFEKAASKGEIRSQFNLGVMHYVGEGVTQDFAKAKQWFEKAATQGNARSQFNLGVMYYQAQGLTQDFAKAMDLFTKAAMQGMGEAQFNLGVMYAKGEGVDSSVSDAYKWFETSRNFGNDRAAEILVDVQSKLSKEQVKDLKAKADALILEIRSNMDSAVKAATK